MLDESFDQMPAATTKPAAGGALVVVAGSRGTTEETTFTLLGTFHRADEQTGENQQHGARNQMHKHDSEPVHRVEVHLYTDILRAETRTLLYYIYICLKWPK